MAERKFTLIFLLIITIIAFVHIDTVHGWRTFWKGRHFNGNLQLQNVNVSLEKLPSDQWFNQKLDHFDASNTETWKQVSF